MADPRSTRRQRVWRARFLLALLALLTTMAALGWWIGYRAADTAVTARPALWRISQGTREAYLFGTIHAVPRNARWLSPAIARAVERSDLLLLEVTNLESERRTRAIFEQLGRSPGLPAISARLDTADAARFAALERQYPGELRHLARYESWAAALLINAAASSSLALSADNAGEAVLSARFTQAGKPVEGLEAIAGQLGLFDTLPQSDQQRLLTQAVREAGDASDLYHALYTAWASGDVASLQRQFLEPFARAPNLWHVLVDARNRRWSTLIDQRLRARPGVIFIAVGAGHLIGAQSVQARLATLGWRIERLQ
ncbi:MAG TPA: TraB/GumN family protein [Sphingobium sp.]|nr:TraB/GumN family protein [Sphingobium sp.]